MNDLNKINKIAGWAVFLLALVVYTLTLESSVSLWDCGEFASAADKLQVVHPPGAPLFLMVGRIFALFAAGNTENIGFAINMLSAVSSAACVMFTFWITTHFAKKLVSNDNPQRNILVIGAGLIAALSNTFLDSFWFSAVEAEVYAMSSFFTAMTFWAILRWDAVTEAHPERRAKNDRWLIFIAFVTGLALGTHMLNLLVIPAICLAVYFRRYKVTPVGLMGALGAALLALGIVMKVIYPGIPALLASMDRLFVNSFGLPFYSGGLFAILMIIAALAGLIYYSHKKGKYGWNLFGLGMTFVIFGYSSYAMVVIRSIADPPIDMNDPEDFNKFYGYITREQYGDRPLLSGPWYNSQPSGLDSVGKRYFKGKERYEEASSKVEYTYDGSEKTFFPRMLGSGRGEGDDKLLRSWSGMTEVEEALNDVNNRIEQMQRSGKGTPEGLRALQDERQMLLAEHPTFGNNLRYFFNYQVGYMYCRYFAWNFIGRSNDQQGFSWNSEDGAIYSGFGSNSKMPDYYKNQKAKNPYYFLPFILGILGIIFHFKNQAKDAWLVLTLFLFTGLLIVVYMNQPPAEPRERDYALVGSFQTFCIWIGLGALMVYQWLRKVAGRSAAVASIAVCTILVPLNMGYQNWDDHDRSGRSIGIDAAKNFLESLDKNAVLLCNGDNDTYPLWYAQNVAGIRTDVRIINMSLLGSDWYSSVLLEKKYLSEPLPLTLTKEDLQANKMEGGMDLIKGTMEGTAMMKKLRADLASNPKGSFPAKTFYFKCYKDLAKQAGLVEPYLYNYMVDTMTITVPKGYATKGDVVLYDFIMQNAATGWKRPIYFTSVSGNDFNGLQNYLQLEGLVYKLVPVKSKPEQGGIPSLVGEKKMYNNFVNLYKYYGMTKKKNFFLDDKAAYMPQNMRDFVIQFAERVNQDEKYVATEEQAKKANQSLAPRDPFTTWDEYKNWVVTNSAERKKMALDMIKKIDTEMPNSAFPYRRENQFMLGMYAYLFGDKVLGEKLMVDGVKQCAQYEKAFGDDLTNDPGGIGRAQYFLEKVTIPELTAAGHTEMAKKLTTMYAPIRKNFNY